jgi:pimeloyl-ACP methyl ester carboxylesterase
MRYKTVKINGLNVFYRECGSDDKPVMLLFHGFPTAVQK